MRSVAERFEFRVNWLPFLLRSNTPVEGVAKAPAEPGNPRVGVRLKKAGQDVGIDFTGKTDVCPNTVAAHALLEYARSKDSALQDRLSEQLFQAYFTDGIAPDVEHLPSIAARVGFTADEVNQVIQDPSKLDAAKHAALSWSNSGVSGVPCFYMNGMKAFAGAQPEDAFVRMFEIAVEKGTPVEGKQGQV